jgi:hypothetical protein
MARSATYVGMCVGGPLSRCLHNLKDGRKDANGAEQVAGIGADMHIMGAIGEAAVAQHYGIEWKPMEFRRVDVGGFEVRSTDYKLGRLVLHEGDRIGCPYILARLHKLPVVVLVGWLAGEDGDEEEGDEWVLPPEWRALLVLQ